VVGETVLSLVLKKNPLDPFPPRDQVMSFLRLPIRTAINKGPPPTKKEEGLVRYLITNAYRMAVR
jgi:hypothetical protein